MRIVLPISAARAFIRLLAPSLSARENSSSPITSIWIRPTFPWQKKIARTIRASNGGLPHVKAIGIELKDRKLSQVSMNLTDFEQTSIRRVFEAVRLEAQRNRCSIRNSEIVGLVPRKALGPDDAAYLRLENFEPAQKILESRLEMRPNEEAPDGISLPSIGS